MKRTIVIGSRGSDLALWQANHIKDMLSNIGISSDIKIIKTKGDYIQHLSFDKIEGKGFFTKEIENELLDKKVDLAVHSLKDLETDQPNGLMIAAVPDREDPADCLLIKSSSYSTSSFLNLSPNSIVGTSSSRRKNQLLFFREDLEIKDLRGNVPTRVEKLKNGDYDAIVLAKAGLNRLNVDLSKIKIYDLDPKIFIPAPGQGALALQIRSEDEELRMKLQIINKQNIADNVFFERSILNGIGGGCHSPFGAYSIEDSNGVRTTWLTYSEKTEQIPYRTVIKGEDYHQLVCQIKKKKSPKKIFISRDLNGDSVFKKLMLNQKLPLTACSLIEKEKMEVLELPDCDWIFFNSSFAYDSISHLNSFIQNKKLAAIGLGTARYLKSKGLFLEFVGDGTPNNVAQKFRACVMGDQVVFFPSSSRSVGTVEKELSNKNKIVAKTYQTNLKGLHFSSHDILVFTSPSNVKAYFDFNSYNGEEVISIGTTTTSCLNDLGIIKIHESINSSELSLADTVLSLI